MTIYLKIEGVSGSVTAKNYEGWIAASDVDFAGVGNTTQMEVGRQVDRVNSKPYMGQVAIIKSLDKASAKFFEAAHSAKPFSSVDIAYVTTGDPNFTYAKVTLKNVVVTHYSDQFNARYNGRPSELVCLAYTDMKRSFTPRSSSNGLTSPVVAGYSVEQAQKL